MSTEPNDRCGTYAGWSLHHRVGTPMCDPCRRAAAEYMAWRRFVTGTHRTPQTCRACGSVFPTHRCDAPREDRR